MLHAFHKCFDINMNENQYCYGIDKLRFIVGLDGFVQGNGGDSEVMKTIFMVVITHDSDNWWFQILVVEWLGKGLKDIKLS